MVSLGFMSKDTSSAYGCCSTDYSLNLMLLRTSIGNSQINCSKAPAPLYLSKQEKGFDMEVKSISRTYKFTILNTLIISILLIMGTRILSDVDRYQGHLKELETTMVDPSITAFAGTKSLSFSAIVKCVSSPPSASSPDPIWSK